MSTNIHCHQERNWQGAWHHVGEVELDQCYGFLAGVRNYSAITPISEPRGLPEVTSQTVRESYIPGSHHDASWLDALELQNYDYEQIIEDKRGVVQTGNYGATLEKGKLMPLHEFLPPRFFKVLQGMLALDRLVFWFDS